MSNYIIKPLYLKRKPLGKSTAELSPEEKNEVSHRANALKEFYKKLKEAGYADK